MIAVIGILGMVATALLYVIIIQFIIGLLFAFNVVSPRNDFLMQIHSSINLLLDPILRPIRRLLPDTGAIDFSPMVLILGLNALIYYILPSLIRI